MKSMDGWMKKLHNSEIWNMDVIKTQWMDGWKNLRYNTKRGVIEPPRCMKTPRCNTKPTI
jgi:hypothetical protein